MIHPSLTSHLLSSASASTRRTLTAICTTHGRISAFRTSAKPSPRVGDFIVSRWLRDSSDEGQVWSNRTVYVVEAVYYRPDKRNSDADDSWVVLVVHDRQMKEEEAELL